MACIARRRAIVVWRLPLPDRVSVPSLLLDDAERRRAARWRHLDDRNRFVLGRSALRSLLGSVLGLPPDAVPLRQRPGAAPELTGDGPVPPLWWSVSHGGRLVVVAVARRPVGVDVEPVASGRPWTRREALMKAGRPDGRPPTWRVARLPVDQHHVGSVAAPGLWRLRLVTRDLAFAPVGGGGPS
jgi:hypothetical protein